MRLSGWVVKKINLLNDMSISEPTQLDFKVSLDRSEEAKLFLSNLTDPEYGVAKFCVLTQLCTLGPIAIANVRKHCAQALGIKQLKTFRVYARDWTKQPRADSEITVSVFGTQKNITRLINKLEDKHGKI
jgi:hypothetical protein